MERIKLTQQAIEITFKSDPDSKLLPVFIKHKQKLLRQKELEESARLLEKNRATAEEFKGMKLLTSFKIIPNECGRQKI
jgi:hypothetical protein